MSGSVVEQHAALRRGAERRVERCGCVRKNHGMIIGMLPDADRRDAVHHGALRHAAKHCGHSMEERRGRQVAMRDQKEKDRGWVPGPRIRTAMRSRGLAMRGTAWQWREGRSPWQTCGSRVCPRSKRSNTLHRWASRSGASRRVVQEGIDEVDHDWVWPGMPQCEALRCHTMRGYARCVGRWIYRSPPAASGSLVAGWRSASDS